MSKASLIRVVNSVYLQLWEVAKNDPDFIEEIRTLSQLQRFTVPQLQFHLAMLRSLYPFQVEETVIDVVREVARKKGSTADAALGLIQLVAPLWLDAEASEEDFKTFVASLFSAISGHICLTLPEMGDKRVLH